MLGQLKSEGGCQRLHRGGEKAEGTACGDIRERVARDRQCQGSDGEHAWSIYEGERGGQGRSRTQVLWGLWPL